MNPRFDKAEYHDWSSSTEVPTELDDQASPSLSELNNNNNDNNVSTPTESTSLPSLPSFLQAQLDSPDKAFRENQAMSMKEIDAKLHALRRENFDLKLRLFYERQRTKRSETELCSPDKTETNFVEDYRRMLREKDDQIKEMRNKMFHLEKNKETEILTLRNELHANQVERDSLSNDVKTITSLCKSFINHLGDMRALWTSHLPEKFLNDSRLIDCLHNWLNSSEDLLNSASVLMECYGGSYHLPENINFNSSLPISDHFSMNNSMIDLNEKEKREYLKYKSLLYDLTSGSEDDWSEPDKTVSQSRIGLDASQLCQSTSSQSQQKLKSKKMYSSGLSSLAFLSDLSEFVNQKKHKSRHKPQKTSVKIQTLLVSNDMDTLISTFQSLQSKCCQDFSTQTDGNSKPVELNDNSSQTATPLLCDMSIQTGPSVLKIDQFTETDTCALQNRVLNEKGSELSKRDKSNPTKFSSSSSKTVNHEVIHTKVSQSIQSLQSCRSKIISHSKQSVKDDRKISPLQGSSKSFLSQSESSPERMEGKPLSPLNREYNSLWSSKATSIGHDENKPVKEKLKTSPVGDIRHISSDFGCNSNHLDKFDEVLHAIKGRYILDELNLNLESSWNIDAKCDAPQLYGPEKNHLSSPDLGIGDSDPDGKNPLRAYISLGYYQLLRGNLNQLFSHLNCLDNLYRERFVLQSITENEYASGLKLSLSNFHQIVNSCQCIWKNFVIENEKSLFVQLEKMRAKKENMENYITRQLKRTDRLLKKAKINLKDG
ncbi:uncharacterized protein LOC141853230 [Brevipalpus obovatus]|uniref:uncharacterized protein LOC141853230 n=1 Tax=Brevipalpus obovatus TaxID=246614 RepID=UPI003D9DB277